LARQKLSALSRKLAQALAVAAHGFAVHGEVLDLTRLGVGEPEIPRQDRVQLLRREQVDHVDVEAALQQGLEAPLVSGGVE